MRYKIIKILLCICSIVYSTCEIQVNGLHGHICTITLPENATVADAIRLIRDDTGDYKRKITLVSGATTLVEDEYFPPEIKNVQCIFRNIFFIKVKYGQLCFVDKSLRALRFDDEAVQCKFGRTFPDGEYEMDKFFALAEEMYKKVLEKDPWLHPREFDGIDFHYGYRSATAKQHVFEKMLETGMMEVFSDDNDKTNYIIKGELWTLAMTHFGAITGNTPGLCNLSADIYLKGLKGEGGYARADGTIPGVSDALVAYMDRILATHPRVIYAKVSTMGDPLGVCELMTSMSGIEAFDHLIKWISEKKDKPEHMVRLVYKKPDQNAPEKIEVDQFADIFQNLPQDVHELDFQFFTSPSGPRYVMHILAEFNSKNPHLLIGYERLGRQFYGLISIRDNPHIVSGAILIALDFDTTKPQHHRINPQKEREDFILGLLEAISHASNTQEYLLECESDFEDWKNSKGTEFKSHSEVSRHEILGDSTCTGSKINHGQWECIFYDESRIGNIYFNNRDRNMIYSVERIQGMQESPIIYVQKCIRRYMCQLFDKLAAS